MQGYWHEYEQFNLKSLNVAVQEIGLALFLVLSHPSHIVKLSIGCPETKTWSAYFERGKCCGPFGWLIPLVKKSGHIKLASTSSLH